MVTGSLLIYIKTKDFYKGIADNVKKWFDTSSYSKDDNRPLPVGNNKKIIGLFKDKVGAKIMKVFVGLRAKTWAYLMDDDSEHKKAKGTKKIIIMIIKRGLIIKDYIDCLFNDEIIVKSRERFKSDYHYVYTERINNIVRSGNDDKRLLTFDKITMYPYGTNAFKVCESEMLSKI